MLITFDTSRLGWPAPRRSYATLAQSTLRALYRWEREPEPERLIEEIRHTFALRTRTAEGSLPEASSWNIGDRLG